MNKFWNYSKKLGFWYRNSDKLNKNGDKKFTWKYIQDLYARSEPFFDDKNYPWINSGLKNQTNYKIRYLPHLKLIQISFQQSHGNFDWFINFLFFKAWKIKPYKKMPIVYKTHMGFTLSYKSVQDEIKAKIEEIAKANEVTDIEIFGWSYGGAMTQLCLEDLTYHYVINREGEKFFKNSIPLITGLTIGSPRVFYKTNIKSWETIQNRLSRLIMVANRNDIVTHAAPSFTGSKHILPLWGVGGKFNLKKFFTPTIYHTKTEYREQINKQED